MENSQRITSKQMSKHFLTSLLQKSNGNSEEKINSSNVGRHRDMAKRRVRQSLETCLSSANSWVSPSCSTVPSQQTWYLTQKGHLFIYSDLDLAKPGRSGRQRLLLEGTHSGCLPLRTMASLLLEFNTAFSQPYERKGC